MHETVRRVVRLDCWCASRGVCHSCQHKDVMLYRCPGCGHRFCFCCSHRLDHSFVCDVCMNVWLGLMTKLTLPREVTRWFNDITL
jgi:hypothetical protein